MLVLKVERWIQARITNTTIYEMIDKKINRQNKRMENMY